MQPRNSDQHGAVMVRISRAVVNIDYAGANRMEQVRTQTSQTQPRSCFSAAGAFHLRREVDFAGAVRQYGDQCG